MGELSVLAGFWVVGLAAAWYGIRTAATEESSWYAALRQPPWTPPHWAYGPTWALLYLTAGAGAWMVWRRVGWDPQGLLLLGAALGLHLVWWTVFFRFRDPGAALVVAGLLVVVTAGAVVAAYRLQPLAGLLVLPYALWMALMAVTNYQVWRLNAL